MGSSKHVQELDHWVSIGDEGVVERDQGRKGQVESQKRPVPYMDEIQEDVMTF